MTQPAKKATFSEWIVQIMVEKFQNGTQVDPCLLFPSRVEKRAILYDNTWHLNGRPYQNPKEHFFSSKFTSFTLSGFVT